MNRYVGIFGMVLAVFAVLGIIAYTQFEIRPVKKRFSASREVRANDLAALERWLDANGHPVRSLPEGDSYSVEAAPEKTVYIEAASFKWEYSNLDSVASWIRSGGNLIVSLDYVPGEDSSLAAFLESFGVGVEEYPFLSSEDEGEVPPETPEEEYPHFDYRIRFVIHNLPDIRSDVITVDGNIRLAVISAGEGRLTVTGRPVFMANASITGEANARLAWELFDAEEGGVLFVRGRRVIKSFFGKFAERGDFRPFCLSLLLLVAAGFWMVIPGFGLVRDEKELSLRPIEERFRAEVRFLKKYDSLAVYLDSYVRELRRILRLRGGTAETGETGRIGAALDSGKKMRYREIIRDLLILEKQWRLYDGRTGEADRQ
ncbi:MAG: hypothetical protein LBI86_11925 [Treponema sp.]|jgi:hypothetical protein|nr:hypothetical protein [Treponema sp.]